VKSGDREPGAGSRVVTGTVLEEMPRSVFRVELDSKQQILAHAVGMVKRNFVRLLPGDRVEVALAPRDWTRGRITRRLTGIEAK